MSNAENFVNSQLKDSNEIEEKISRYVRVTPTTEEEFLEKYVNEELNIAFTIYPLSKYLDNTKSIQLNRFFGYRYYNLSNGVFDWIKKLCSNHREMVIVAINYGDNEKILDTTACKGCYSAFIIFNATRTHDVTEREARVYIYNSGRGALTKYSLDHFLKYSSDSVYYG